MYYNFETTKYYSYVLFLPTFRYFPVYSHRLSALRERVVESAKDQLGAKAIIKRLSDLDEIDKDQNVVVIGTLFKTQMLKPNILKEVGEETATTNEKQ